MAKNQPKQLPGSGEELAKHNIGDNVKYKYYQRQKKKRLNKEQKVREKFNKNQIDWGSRILELRRCIESGMTMPELAVHFKTKSINISQVMFRHGLHVKRRVTDLPEWKIKAMIALRKAHFTLKAIGEIFDHAEPTIARYLENVPDKLWQSVAACSDIESLTKGVECDTVEGSRVLPFTQPNKETEHG